MSEENTPASGETADTSPEPSATSAAPGRRPPKKKKGGYPFIVGSIIAIGVMLVVSSSFSSGTYSLTVTALASAPDRYMDRDVKIVGQVKEGSMDVKTASDRRIELHFVVEDGKGGEVAVVYPHTPPDPFKEGREVIVEGTVQPGEGAAPSVLCHILTVKCPSKYQEEGLQNADEEYYREKYGKAFPVNEP